MILRELDECDCPNVNKASVTVPDVPCDDIGLCVCLTCPAVKHNLILSEIRAAVNLIKYNRDYEQHISIATLIDKQRYKCPEELRNKEARGLILHCAISPIIDGNRMRRVVGNNGEKYRDLFTHLQMYDAVAFLALLGT